MAITCPSCAAENPDDKRFCGDCGGALALVCPSCGATVDPGKKFCGDCGSPMVGASAAAAPAPPAADGGRRVAERRLTTILFGDLEGFTTVAEARDAEDTRELLSQYFAMATTVVARYGGTIEKFIGDAVMAVWGVPVAHEDDAERAVRAGLDLVAEMAGLAEKVGVPDLNMRVGIVTGEVAVTLGAVGEGMVAGDVVNTAARVQSVAEAGQVWVDELTRSLTSGAVTYTPAGLHSLKGKTDAVQLYAARGIETGVGGVQRVDGLEAPFLGRDHELRLMKELFQAATDEARPRLVAVFGAAGIGKTRLASELERYVDSLPEFVRWHRARVLSYGDGVSFWALAEMVRARLGVTDGEPSSVVESKLSTGLERYAVDPGEAEWLRPRLAVLLGLDSGRAEVQAGFARDELFAAWSTFFERVREEDRCVVLVFDDMQYADPDLLDFLDHLLESARFPLFVVTLARPELADARLGWGTGRRATPLYLEPLSETAMGEIVNGLVQGLPDQACQSLVERSEGIPLYALEMVRGLIDRDAVVPSGGHYVLAPDADQRVDLGTLDAPPSLQALIAARLDALTPAERQVTQDATAHGLVFSRDALEAVTSVPDLDTVLAELVRKEILAVHTDRFSPERGQFRFAQSLVRTVAYETLSRRDRKVRHLAVAHYLEQTSEGDEVAAIIARHYIDALDSGPDDEDAPTLIAAARELLERAALRAEALGSPDEALRHYTAAVARESDASNRGRLLEGAARTARSSNRSAEALAYAEQAHAAYESVGKHIAAGQAMALIGDLLLDEGHVQASLDRMVPVYERLVGNPEAEVATMFLAGNISRAHMGTNDVKTAQIYADHALELAENRQDWERVATGLGRQGVLWLIGRRPTGGLALLRAAADVGRREHFPQAMITPLVNLSAFLKNRDLQAGREAGREGLELSKQLGARHLVRSVVINLALANWVSGDWDEVETLYAQHHDDFEGHGMDLALFHAVLALIRTARGEPVGVELTAVELEAGNEITAYISTMTDALMAEQAGDLGSAARLFAKATSSVFRDSGADDDFLILWPLAVDHLLAAGEIAEAERLVDLIANAPRVEVTPLAYAHLLRLRALLAIATGGDPVTIDADLELATAALRDFGARFYAGRTLLERAQQLTERGDHEAAAPLLEQAQAAFVELGANRWLEATRGLSSVR